MQVQDINIVNNLIQLVSVLVGAGAGSFFGLKGAINGLKKDVEVVGKCAQDIEHNIDTMQRDVTKIKTIVELESRY